MYTQIIIKKIKKSLTFIKKFIIIQKKFLHLRIIKKTFCLLNIRMVNPALNLSLNELRLIVEHRNISDYESKSAKNLIKALRGSRPKLGIKKNMLKKIKEDFYNLRHKFSKKGADEYREIFYDIKNYRHLSELEIEEIRKSLIN